MEHKFTSHKTQQVQELRRSNAAAPHANKRRPGRAQRAADTRREMWQQ